MYLDYTITQIRHRLQSCLFNDYNQLVYNSFAGINKIAFDCQIKAKVYRVRYENSRYLCYLLREKCFTMSIHLFKASNLSWKRVSVGLIKNN